MTKMEKITAQHSHFRNLYYQEQKSHYFNWGIGLFFWLFLGIAMPFGIYNHSFQSYFSLLLHLIPLAIIWPLWSIIIDYLVVKINPEWNQINRKNMMVWGLKILLIIHTIFLYRGDSCEWQCIDLKEYLEIWLACLIVFGVAYVLFASRGKNLYYRKVINAAASSQYLLINGEGKEVVRVLPENLYYIQSDDNYLDLMLSEDGKTLQKKTLRATLKSVAEQLSDYPNFIRCHRSFIVNASKIVDIENDKNILLSVNKKIEPIPLSKTYRPKFSHLVLKK